MRSEEYDLLEQVFGVQGSNDLVEYKSLVEEVETVFTIKGLEKDPLKRPKEFTVPDFLDPEKRLSPEDSEFLHQVMVKLALLMKKYRVMPKAYFKDAVNIIYFLLYLG